MTLLGLIDTMGTEKSTAGVTGVGAHPCAVTS
jgi:hypothetical protein